MPFPRALVAKLTQRNNRTYELGLLIFHPVLMSITLPVDTPNLKC